MASSIKSTLLFFALMIFSCGCNQEVTPRIVNSEKKSSQLETIRKDTLKPVLEEIVAVSDLDSFLLRPFDLYKFKKKVGSSNSGGGGRKTYWHKPSYPGIFYSFFLFSNLEGYLGRRKDIIVRKEHGLHITTYKPKGKYETQFLDPDEELVEVIEWFNHHDLPELAFVGLDSLEVKKCLGDKRHYLNDSYVYSYKDRALILHFEDKYVKWLRYVHLKTPFRVSDFDPVLFEDSFY